MIENRPVIKSEMTQYLVKLAQSAFAEREKKALADFQACGPKLYAALFSKSQQAAMNKLPKSAFRRDDSIGIWIDTGIAPTKYGNRETIPVYLSKDRAEVPIPQNWYDIHSLQQVTIDQLHDPDLYVEARRAMNAKQSELRDLYQERRAFFANANILLANVRNEKALRKVWPEIADDYFATYGAVVKTTAIALVCEPLNQIIGKVRLADVLQKEAALAA